MEAQKAAVKESPAPTVSATGTFGYPGIDLQDKCWILLAKYNLKMLILTCGINGSYVFTPGVVSFQETPNIRLIVISSSSLIFKMLQRLKDSRNTSFV